MNAVRRSSIVSVLGVYPVNYDNFPLSQFFDKGIILRGQAPTHKHIDKLLEYVIQGKVKLDDIITHRFPFSEISGMDMIFSRNENMAM